MARAKAGRQSKAVKAKTARRKVRRQASKTRTKPRKAVARVTTRRGKSGAKAKAKTFTILLAGVPESEVIRDVRTAIKREVSLGGETNFRWVPAEPPMALRPQQWQATGDAVVDGLRRKYPKLVVKRQEIGAHHKKELTTFREFLTKRITS